MTTPTPEKSVDEIVEELPSKHPASEPEQAVVWKRDVVKLLQAERQKREEMVGKRNGVIKEYKDEGVMFILKVEDGKTYEASMPIPKWAEVGKVELRITQPNNPK